MRKHARAFDARIPVSSMAEDIDSGQILDYLASLVTCTSAWTFNGDFCGYELVCLVG